MKKTITNAEADLVLAALTDIAKSEANVPVRVGFRILQNVRAIEPVVNIYRSENDRIIREASGGREKLERSKDPEAFDRCQAMLKELAGVEVEVDIAEVEPKDLDDLKLPMKTLFALKFITKDPDGGNSDG